MSDRWPDKTVIGLTGNIATGKSVVRRILEHLGAFGIDADGLAQRAMSPGAPAYQPVIETFGRFILDSERRIDREKLARIVFTDPEALQQLEAIVHPIVVQVVGILIKRAKQKVVAIEAIKLLESGLAKDCDAVWVVDAPRDVQLKRLMEVRKMSEADASMRINAQSPQAGKLAVASTIINNARGYENTFEQVKGHLAALTKEEAPTEPEPVVVAPATPAGVDAEVETTITRAGPKQAEAIAAFINEVQGTSLTRTDIIREFGQKAYMVVNKGKDIIGVAGWQIENLITRITELILRPDAPIKETIKILVGEVEEASDYLQSEIALLYLPKDVDVEMRKAIVACLYEERSPSDFRIPDWREAAEESMQPNTDLFAKKLREDRVLKPI